MQHPPSSINLENLTSNFGQSVQIFFRKKKRRKQWQLQSFLRYTQTQNILKHTNKQVEIRKVTHKNNNEKNLRVVSNSFNYEQRPLYFALLSDWNNFPLT